MWPGLRWFGVLALVIIWFANQIGLFALLVLTVVGFVAHAALWSAWLRSSNRLQEDIENDLRSRYPYYDLKDPSE